MLKNVKLTYYITESSYDLGLFFRIVSRTVTFYHQFNSLGDGEPFRYDYDKITCGRQFVIKPPSVSVLN